MSTMIQAYQPQAVEVYGEDERIASLVKRMRYMIPGADEAPDAVVWKAAQIANMHRLDPFSGDVQVYKIGNSWIVNVGISAWRREAQRQAKYQPVMEQMSDAELQQWLGDKYTQDDVGYRCKVFRLDVARECKELGIPYEPSVAHGFWMQKARYDKYKKKWMPDQTPNTETPDSVARRRAEKKALKIAFSLGYPDLEMQIDARGQLSVVDDVEEQVAQEERNRAPVLTTSAVDENALFVVSDGADAQSAALRTNEVDPIDQNGYGMGTTDDFMVATSDGVNIIDRDPDAEWNAIPSAAESDAAKWANIADSLTGGCRAIAEKAYQSNDGAPASDAQYKFLAGTLDKFSDGNHAHILSVLCRREVSSKSPCSKRLASVLLDCTLKQVPQKDENNRKVTGEDGKVVYVDNPQYRQDIVDCLVQIGEVV